MTGLYKNYINGEWVEGNSVTVNINPSDTNDIIGNYTRATKAQTEEAITSAKHAFASWSRTTPQEPGLGCFLLKYCLTYASAIKYDWR